MALGHTLKDSVYGCHELEVYPDDRLTCGSGNALIAFDMSGAFDDMGTPTDYSDDKPRGTPLPCKSRPSSSAGPFATGATVVDCVDGTNDDPEVGGVSGDEDLTVPGWIAQGSPSLEGVEYLGSIYHQGRGAGGAATPAFDSTEDIDFNHEAELTGSGEHLISTDERGGGVLPPGASCTPVGDNPLGNGGVHFYDLGGLSTAPAGTPEEAFAAYASKPSGDKAIYRAPVRTPPRATVCTAHVFQQIPGENRIFMGWYSQGTQVIDFVENADGTVRFAEAGYFIPDQRQRVGLARVQGRAQPRWIRDLLRRHRRLRPRRGGPQLDRRLQGDAAAGAEGDRRRGRSGHRRRAQHAEPETAPWRSRAAPSATSCSAASAGDRIKGRGGRDKIKGRAGNDCLGGGGGKDAVKGGGGKDTLTGGRGRDRLFGGGGDDKVKARNGGRDKVRCGGGKDRAVVDSRDRVRGCEKVKRKR